MIDQLLSIWQQRRVRKATEKLGAAIGSCLGDLAVMQTVRTSIASVRELNGSGTREVLLAAANVIAPTPVGQEILSRLASIIGLGPKPEAKQEPAPFDQAAWARLFDALYERGAAKETGSIADMAADFIEKVSPKDEKPNAAGDDER